MTPADCNLLPPVCTKLVHHNHIGMCVVFVCATWHTVGRNCNRSECDSKPSSQSVVSLVNMGQMRLWIVACKLCLRLLCMQSSRSRTCLNRTTHSCQDKSAWLLGWPCVGSGKELWAPSPRPAEPTKQRLSLEAAAVLATSQHIYQPQCSESDACISAAGLC